MPFTPPVRVQFNEAKAAQAAARLLQSHGGKMNYMKLIKLLYLVDRKSLEGWGRPVTTDRYVSMDRGPVLSAVLDLINYEPGPHSTSPWRDLISEPSGYAVSLVSNEAPPDDELSEAEEMLIDSVYAEYGAKSHWALVDSVHSLPEWQDPRGGALAISYADILKAVGKDDQEIEQIENEMRAASEVDRLLA